MTIPADKPLHGLVVADFGVGMAAALVAKFLAEVGAEVRRVEPQADDPFYDVYPAYAVWRSCLAGVEPASVAAERALLARADICIVGGEDFPGRVLRRDGDAIVALHPRLIVLEIVAALPGFELDRLHGADLLVQARAGMIFENSADRPEVMGFMPSACGAALMALIAISVALYLRESNGRGQIVRAGLLEGALAWLTAFWGRADQETAVYRFNVPRGARPLIFRMRDGGYVHVVLGSAGAKYKLYRILGIDDPSIAPGDPGLPDPSQPPDCFFGDLDLLAPYAARMETDALLDALTREDVVCARVQMAGQVFDDPQAIFNGIVHRSAEGFAYVGSPIDWQIIPGGRPPDVAAVSADRPLAGIRVVDFGAFVAGPAASVGLADLGADVIKVEPPRGDPLRASYGFYAASNRGKRSIAIEMKDAQGLALAHRLARQADVVCSNFRAGVAERLGIDAATLLAAQSEKIVLNNAGYGVAGPRASSPAFDPCIQAMSGLEARSGGAGALPVLNRLMVVDFCGALLGQIGVLMALYRRAVDGRGAAVTVPLLNAGMLLMSDIVRSDGGELTGPLALLSDRSGYHAAERLYRASDGWIAIAARGETAATALARAFGLAARPRADWGPTEGGALADAIAPLTSAEAIAKLDAAGVPAERCAECMRRDFIAEDARVAAGHVYEAERPGLGKVRGIGVLYSMSAVAWAPRGDLSERGEDGRAVMTQAGLDIEEVEALIASGAVVAS